MRRFPALSYSGSESDSSALFSNRIAFTDVLVGGLDQRGVVQEESLAEVVVDMADLMTDSFRRTKMLQCDQHVLEITSTHSVSVRACEQTVLYVMHAVGVYSCVHTPVELSVLAFPQSEDPTIQHALTEKIRKNLTHCSSSDLEECHHHDFQFCQVESLPLCRRRRRSTRQVFPAAPKTTSILTSDQPHGRILQILEIVGSDFDVFVYLSGWV